MSRPYAGGCACGAVRYTCEGEPVAMVDCQCRQCQRQTGGGHGSYLTFAGTPWNVQGAPNTWSVAGDNGTTKNAAFCATCGSPLFITFPDVPGVVAIRAGSLDEPERYQPQLVTWTEAAQPWDHVDPAATKFARMPPAA